MRPLRLITYVLTGIAFIAYFIVFGRLGGIKGMLFLLPLTMTPLIVNLYFAERFRAFWSQAVLLATTVAYAFWFIVVYLDVTIWHPDPQSPIAFLFVGIYALPILFLLWALAWAFNWGARRSLS